MKPNRRPFCSTFLGLILGAGAIGPTAASAQVQVFSSIAVGPGDGEFSDGSRLSGRNLDRYEKVLDLSPDQKEAGKALLDGYLAESRAASKQLQTEMEAAFSAFQDTQDHKAVGEATGAAQKLHSERAAALEKGYFDDLRQLLSPDQEARWPQVERLRRREKGTLRGVLSGESVDLTEVVEELKLDPAASASLAEAMEQYEADMDRALQARDAALADSGEQAPGLGMTFDFAAMQAEMAKAREAGAQVRDVNQTHERRIEVLLPEDRRDDFALAFKRRCFPEVYRASGASRSIDSAARLADLTPEQKSAVEELRAGYDREAEPANNAWADAVAAAEASGQDGAMHMGGAVMRISMGEESGPLADARKARKEIDAKARQRLNSILTPEQQERLPREAQAEGEFIHGGGEAIMIRGGG